MYYVYILFSHKDRKLYTGYTQDVDNRVKDHNQGKNSSTKHRRPLELIYYEAYLEKNDAKGRELFLKGGSGKKYLKKQLKHWYEKNGVITT